MVNNLKIKPVYNAEIEYLTDYGTIDTLYFSNVTYLSFRYYCVSISSNGSKEIIKIDNVLSVHLEKI